MKGFILDNNIHSLSDLGLRITQVPIIPTTERVVDSIDIDGREGSLTMLKGYNDLEFSLKVVTSSQSVWREVFPQILNAQTITFTNDSTIHYKIKVVKSSGLSQLLTNLWEAELTFICSPFRYKNNVATINRTASGTVTNGGNVYSLPLIKVYGTGTRTLTINGKPIVMNLLSEYLIIDSELKECYYGEVACNNQMTGEFPIFKVGSNQVTLGTGITKVEIEARWRYL